MRNKAGQLAAIIPCADAADDIKAHGGKVVRPIQHAACGLGGAAWHTEPQLQDGYGNVIGWDDRDLMPLGTPPNDTLPPRSEAELWESDPHNLAN